MCCRRFLCCNRSWNIIQNDILWFLSHRCLCSQNCTSPDAGWGHPVQPPRSGRSASEPKVPHAPSHKPAAAPSCWCEGECGSVRGVWRWGPAPDLRELPFGPTGRTAMSLIHIPTHLLPPTGPPESSPPHLVWRQEQPLWAGGLPVSITRRNWWLLPEEDLLPAARNPVWPTLHSRFGAGWTGKILDKNAAFWHSSFKRDVKQGLCGANQWWRQWEDRVRMLKGRQNKFVSNVHER